MYNMVCGNNPFYEIFLGMLDMSIDDIPRFRDVYIDIEEEAIVVYTRTGGGNRDEYREENNALAQHPNYMKDADDDFDSTYAHFWFGIPEQFKERTIAMQNLLSSHKKFCHPREKFEHAMQSLKGEEQQQDSPMNDEDLKEAIEIAYELLSDVKSDS